MIEITAAWLTQLGVKVSESEMSQLVGSAMSELELRVGSKVADTLTAEQISEFETIEDEDKSIEWLDKACPSYKDIVQTEYKAMAKEIEVSSEKVKLIQSWS